MPTWVAACMAEDVDIEDVIGFRHEDRDYAVYRTAEGEFFTTDGHRITELWVLGDVDTVKRQLGASAVSSF